MKYDLSVLIYIYFKILSKYIEKKDSYNCYNWYSFMAKRKNKQKTNFTLTHVDKFAIYGAYRL